MKLTVRKKFLIPTLSLVFLGMAFSSIISYQISKKAMSEILIEQLNQVTATASKSLDEWIKEVEIDSINVSKLDMIQHVFKKDSEGDQARQWLDDYLKNFKETYGNFETVSISDASGVVVSSSNRETIGKLDVSDRDYFKKAMNGENAVSDIIKSKTSGNPIVVFAVPLKIGAQVKGVLYSVISMNLFAQNYIDPIKVGEKGYAYIVNAAGLIAILPDREMEFKRRLADIADERNIAGKERGVIDYELDGEHKIVVFNLMKDYGWIVAAGGYTNEIFGSIYKLRSINIFMTIAIVLVLGLVIFFVANSVVKPINIVKEGLKDAAEGEGDLTKRIAVASQDEVGELASWFNVFIEKIQKLISDVGFNAGQLAHSSTALETVSSDLSHGADEISSMATAVSAAGEEMSISMETVAKTMDQNTNNVNMVAAAIEEMESTIQEIAKNTDKARNTSHTAVTQSESVANQMGVLGSAAREIEKVVETITDISEQVNLLALNATIEAARAGEAGKGFAVVANEIKELARQTSQATDEIKQRVTAIQSSTESSTAEMESITRIINDVNDVVTTIAAAIEEQSAATREMTGNVSDTSNGMNDVNANVAESSQVSNEIAGQIADVTRAIQNMAENSNQVKTNAADLSRMADALNDLVGRFKV